MRKLGKSFIYICLFAWTGLVVAPLLFLLITSFKTDAEIAQSPWSFPESFSFHNYIAAWKGNLSTSLGTNFINSTVSTVGSLLLLILLSTLAGYALARYRFPGNGIIYRIMIGLIAVPIYAVLVPMNVFIEDIRLMNNLWSVIFVYAVFSLPFSVIIMKSYFEAIPLAIEESARIDGCRDLGVFWHVGLPVSRGAVATIAIINVVNIWSELLFSSVLLTKPEVRTLPVAISAFADNMYSSSDGVLYASLALATIPLLLTYLIFQRQIVKGMAMGAVK